MLVGGELDHVQVERDHPVRGGRRGTEGRDVDVVRADRHVLGVVEDRPLARRHDVEDDVRCEGGRQGRVDVVRVEEDGLVRIQPERDARGEAGQLMRVRGATQQRALIAVTRAEADTARRLGNALGEVGRVPIAPEVRPEGEVVGPRVHLELELLHVHRLLVREGAVLADLALVRRRDRELPHAHLKAARRAAQVHAASRSRGAEHHHDSHRGDHATDGHHGGR